MSKLSGIKDCAKTYAEKFEVSVAEGERVMKNAIDIIGQEIVVNGGVRFMGAFSLEVKERKARIGRNPKNPTEEIEIPAQNVLKLKVGKDLKEAIN